MSPDIPAPTRCFPILMRASKSGRRSGPQGVMRAGMVPEKTCDGILGLPMVYRAIACRPNHRSCPSSGLSRVSEARRRHGLAFRERGRRRFPLISPDRCGSALAARPGSGTSRKEPRPGGRALGGAEGAELEAPRLHLNVAMRNDRIMTQKGRPEGRL